MLIVLLAAGFFSTCKSSNKTNRSASSDITGRYWKTYQHNGKTCGQPSATGKEMYITLIKEGKILQGNGGCNSFQGKYELKDGGVIKFTGIIATLMACPDMENRIIFFESH
jgi:heat shock protein HslJ